jgi:hypothetical protein
MVSPLYIGSESDTASVGINANETIVPGCHPHSSLLVLDNGVYLILSHILIIEWQDTVVLFVDDIDSCQRSNPYPVIAIFGNGLNTVIGKSVWICRARPKYFDAVPIKTAQSILTSKPHIPFAVIKKTVYGVGWQLIDIWKMLE